MLFTVDDLVFDDDDEERRMIEFCKKVLAAFVEEVKRSMFCFANFLLIFSFGLEFINF